MSNVSILRDAEVRFDKLTGHPAQIRGEFRLPVSDDAPEDAVKAFLVDHAEELELSAMTDDLDTLQDVTTPSGRVVRLQQRKDGIPIFGTELVVRLDKVDRIRQLDLHHVSPPRMAAPVADADKLSPRAARDAAKKAIGEHTLRQRMKNPGEVFYPDKGTLRLAYEVHILSEEPLADWLVLVDAYEGTVLFKQNMIVQDGTGMVFDPNPVVTAADNSLRDPEASPATCGFTGTPLATIDSERVPRTLRDISQSGSDYLLDGPYVRIDPSPEENDPAAFDYSSGTAEFEGVNAYYHIDTLQRYLQGLGIPGAHDHQIRVVPHASQSYASYSSWDDTIRLGHSGPCQPDRGEDGDVMLHEYGHAIHRDQVPTWGSGGDTGAMGEGFGDILATTFFAPDHAFQREVFEDWIFSPAGLRRVDGTKTYPTDLVGSVHSDGEIWSAPLWNIYRAIGGDDLNLATREQARDELIKTLILSHYRLTGTATMPDAAEAFLLENGDLEDFRLVNGIAMLDSFHDRGILPCEVGSDLVIEELWSQQDDTSVRSWEQVEAGQDNWFYARVRNDGDTPARAFVVTFSFKSPFATPVYPADFRTQVRSGAVGFELAPGATMVVKALWPKELIPTIPTGSTQRHGCILAEIYNPVDHVPAGVTHIGGSGQKLKQRNTDIVDLLPDEAADYYLDLGNFNVLRPQLARFEIFRDPRGPQAEISFHHPDRYFLRRLLKSVELVKKPILIGREEVEPLRRVEMLEPTRVSFKTVGGPMVFNLAAGSSLEMMRDVAESEESELTAALGDEQFMHNAMEMVEGDDGDMLRPIAAATAGFTYALFPRRRYLVKLRVKAPRGAKPGDKMVVAMRQRTYKGEVLGEFDIHVNVVARH